MVDGSSGSRPSSISHARFLRVKRHLSSAHRPYPSILTFALLLGCGPREDPNRTPLPTPEDARKAIVAAMESWKSGGPTGRVIAGPPRVQINDSFRRPGQRPVGYDLLGQTRRERAISYVVRVRFADPEATETIRFVLLGIDPVLVFRQEDYDLISNWDHKMDPAPPAAESEPSP